MGLRVRVPPVLLRLRRRASHEPAGVYRPRDPERTVVYRLFEEHFERYVREYEEHVRVRCHSLS